jgi:hypothetical protein
MCLVAYQALQELTATARKDLDPAIDIALAIARRFINDANAARVAREACDSVPMSALAISASPSSASLSTTHAR